MSDFKTSHADDAPLKIFTGEPPRRDIERVAQLSESGAIASARDATLKLLQQYPQSFVLWSYAVSENLKLGDTAAALDCARETTLIFPQLASSFHNLGLALRAQGKADDAIEAFRRAVEIDSDLVSSHFALGLLLYDKGEAQSAAKAFDHVKRLKPDMAAAHFYRGALFMREGNRRAAASAYGEAIKLRPDVAEMHNDLGVALLALSQVEVAISSFRTAAELRPDWAVAHENLGTALLAAREYPAAAEALDRACTIDSKCQSALALMLWAKANIGDFGDNTESMLEVLEKAGEPHPMLAFEDRPDRQLVRSANYWKRTVGNIEALPLPARKNHPSDRLRIGYFSSDLHQHATLHLMSGLIREHDRSRFEIFVYSFGADRRGPLRRRVKGQKLHFHDVETLSAREIVSLARSHDLDVAIDLKGYTSGARPDLFAYRLAPLQVSYLGYPGTMGCAAFDYLVADSTVIPPQYRDYYSERIIFLPHSYQANDNQREIATTSTTRSDFGLPDSAFVFCCFNSPYKISIQEFEIWMRILGKVEGSVLWLLALNPWVEKNLKDRASTFGISPTRLIFAEKASHAEHLARHRHADLFIDTFNCNAHTTASDALWSGLPVVTKAGRQFAARVAASLLNAIGLPELVTETVADYEALIIELATRPEKMAGIRKRLAENRLKQPLFDTARYARNFEKGLWLAQELYSAGKSAEHIIVQEAMEIGKNADERNFILCKPALLPDY